MKKYFDVVQTVFGDKEHFQPRVIATCKSYQQARGVIARCNTGMHTFDIVEREGMVTSGMNIVQDTPELQLQNSPAYDTELATVEDFAAAIDEFSYDYDTYGYNDACDDREVALAEITASIHSGNVVHLEDWLAGIVREKDSNSMTALKLLDCLRIQKHQGLLEQFQNSPHDAYAIFQLKNGDELHDLRFSSLSYAQSSGRTVKRENYNLVYVNQLKAEGSTSDKLDVLYYRFNISHPFDFRGHSLSVSDIVALKQNGVVSCHYVDSVGFAELPNFLLPNVPVHHEAGSIKRVEPICQKDGLDLDR